MDMEEIKKLRDDLTDCFRRYDEAMERFISTNGSLEAIQELKKIDQECKALNKKYWEEMEL